MASKIHPLPLHDILQYGNGAYALITYDNSVRILLSICLACTKLQLVFLVSLQLHCWRAKTLIAWKSLCCQGFRKQEKLYSHVLKGWHTVIEGDWGRVFLGKCKDYPVLVASQTSWVPKMATGNLDLSGRTEIYSSHSIENEHVFSVWMI